MTAPQWSIVVPTFGRGQALAGLLEALSRLQPPPGGFEVVIVDDGSPEPLDSVIAPFSDRLAISLYRKTNGGPASARNYGAGQTRGRWLAFTDDDCRPRQDWLIAMQAALAAEPQALVGGHTRNGLADNLCAEASQTLTDYLGARDLADSANMAFVASNNIALSRAGFSAVGGFDENYPLAAGEDREFCDRWRASGRPIRFLPAARVEHLHRLTLGGFWRQHRNYGRGAYRVHRQRARQSSQGGRFESAGFYAGIVAYPFRARLRQPLRLSLLMLVSQAATTAGYAREALASRASR